MLVNAEPVLGDTLALHTLRQTLTMLELLHACCTLLGVTVDWLAVLV